jgi:hypothetical protein
VSEGVTPPGAGQNTLRDRLDSRLVALRTEYAGSWREHHKEIADFFLPRRARFFTTDRNRGSKRNDKIKNNTGTRAIRVSTAGLMSGLTSPSRTWFRLTTPDPELAKWEPVKFYLEDVERRMRDVLQRSNFYGTRPGHYESLLAFGVSALGVETDPQTVVRFYHFPVGSFYVANGPRGVVDTIYREFTMTVSQIVRRFGLEACSESTRRMYQQGDYDKWVDVCHAIEPRYDRDPSRRDRMNMPVQSCYWEKGADHGKLLSVSGFRRFPALVPRWSVTGEDVYGNSPAMDVLADCKQLQAASTHKMRLVHLLAEPPQKQPSSVASMRRPYPQPGDFIPVDETNPNARLEPIYVPDPRALVAVREEIADLSEAVWQGMYADVFLMISALEAGGSKVTAAEIYARQEEKMLQLGPVLEGLQNEDHDPVIDLVFDAMSEAGLLPPPPYELEGQDLRVEYVSVLAQAQKAVETGGIRQVAEFALAFAEADPTALDGLDTAEAVWAFGDALGVSSKILRDREERDQVRAERQQMQAAQMAPEAMKGLQAGAQAAKAMSETQVGDGTALDALAEAA